MERRNVLLAARPTCPVTIYCELRGNTHAAASRKSFGSQSFQFASPYDSRELTAHMYIPRIYAYTYIIYERVLMIMITRLINNVRE